MDTKAFIREIIKRPSIWKSKHLQHKFKNVQRKLWIEIKQCFPDYEIDQLKKKWKNLKDTHRKELKRTANIRSIDMGSDDETLSQWPYFSIMSFINEELMPTDNDSGLMTVNKQEREDVDASPQSEAESTPPPSPSAQLSNSQPGTSLGTRKRSANDIRTEYLEIERKKLKILEEEVAKNNTLNQVTSEGEPIQQTDDYYYLMSILPTMQKFSSIQKMRVRNKINQVLMDEMEINMHADTAYASRGYYAQQTATFEPSYILSSNDKLTEDTK